jgi:hypothetical protein
MSAKQLAAMAFAAAALTVAGCGGSSKTGSTTTSAAVKPAQSTTATQTSPVGSGEEIKVSSGKPLRRAVWIAKGDAICQRTQTMLSTTTAKTTQDFARLLPQAAGYERTEATELAKLVPPTAMIADWRQIIGDLQKVSEFSLKAAQYAQVNNWSAAVPVATAGNKIATELVVIAKRDGFKVCSVP